MQWFCRNKLFQGGRKTQAGKNRPEKQARKRMMYSILLYILYQLREVYELSSIFVIALSWLLNGTNRPKRHTLQWVASRWVLCRWQLYSVDVVMYISKIIHVYILLVSIEGKKVYWDSTIPFTAVPVTWLSMMSWLKLKGQVSRAVYTQSGHCLHCLLLWLSAIPTKVVGSMASISATQLSVRSWLELNLCTCLLPHVSAMLVSLLCYNIRTNSFHWLQWLGLKKLRKDSGHLTACQKTQFSASSCAPRVRNCVHHVNADP